GLECADLAVERVRERVKKGGHGIPEEDLRNRYNRSFEQLNKIIEYCDKIELYDNTISFRGIAVYENKKWTLIDNDVPCWCRNIIKQER
ncbi:MAG: ATPase, partial [Firmicutes bacterium]|nr:ATPase [Bacillota bacterium]